MTILRPETTDQVGPHPLAKYSAGVLATLTQFVIALALLGWVVERLAVAGFFYQAYDIVELWLAWKHGEVLPSAIAPPTSVTPIEPKVEPRAPSPIIRQRSGSWQTSPVSPNSLPSRYAPKSGSPDQVPPASALPQEEKSATVAQNNRQAIVHSDLEGYLLWLAELNTTVEAQRAPIESWGDRVEALFFNVRGRQLGGSQERRLRLLKESKRLFAAEVELDQIQAKLRGQQKFLQPSLADPSAWHPAEGLYRATYDLEKQIKAVTTLIANVDGQLDTLLVESARSPERATYSLQCLLEADYFGPFLSEHIDNVLNENPDAVKEFIFSQDPWYFSRFTYNGSGRRREVEKRYGSSTSPEN